MIKTILSLIVLLFLVKAGRIVYNRGIEEGYRRTANLNCTQDESGTYDKCVANQLEYYHRLAHHFKGK